jgi:hypothetical protein
MPHSCFLRHRCLTWVWPVFVSHCSFPGRRAGSPAGRMRVMRQRGATKGAQLQEFGQKYEWGEGLKHKEMPERDCGHFSWVRYPFMGLDQSRTVPPCHLTVANLIREKPVPNRASSVPTTTVPDVRDGRGGPGAGKRRVDTGRKHAPNRGETGEAQSRTSGEDLQPAHASTARPGSCGNAAFGWGRRKRSMCVIPGGDLADTKSAAC